MNRLALWGVIAGLSLAPPVSAETYFGFQIGISNAPPPPMVVFREEPEVIYVHSSGVYVVDSRYDYDIFRYRGYYYACNDGYWYRARSHRGPFRFIDARRVPQSVYYVPQRHWKRHWKNRHYADHRDGDHDRGRGRGRGNKNGHRDRD